MQCTTNKRQNDTQRRLAHTHQLNDFSINKLKVTKYENLIISGNIVHNLRTTVRKRKKIQEKFYLKF